MQTCIRRAFTLAAVPFAVAGAAHAAEVDDTIATDRPDFVESSRTVGKAHFQIETSVARERDSRAGVKTTTFSTPTLLRYGVSDSWELRYETDGFMRSRTVDTGAATDEVERGMADSSIGLKWAMQEGEGVTPGVAWLLHADVDSGSRAFRGHGVRPSLRAVFEWELPAEFSLGVMPGIAYDTTDAGKRHVAGILGVVVGRSWTDNFRTFVEVAGQHIASSRNGGSVVTYDVGAAYLITKNVQIDTAFAWGANSNTPKFAWTIGLSVKF